MYAWGQDVLEFVATGTAVKAIAGTGAHRAPDGRAFTSDLSAQDFFRLLAAGAVPVAFVLGTCVYHIGPPVGHAGAPADRPEPGDGSSFTQGVYDARELAPAADAGRGDQRAKSSGSSGQRGRLETTSGVSTPRNSSRRATAIRRLADEHRLPRRRPSLTFTLGLDV